MSRIPSEMVHSQDSSSFAYITKYIFLYYEERLVMIPSVSMTVFCAEYESYSLFMNSICPLAAVIVVYSNLLCSSINNQCFNLSLYIVVLLMKLHRCPQQGPSRPSFGPQRPALLSIPLLLFQQHRWRFPFMKIILVCIDEFESNSIAHAEDLLNQYPLKHRPLTPSQRDEMIQLAHYMTDIVYSEVVNHF